MIVELKPPFSACGDDVAANTGGIEVKAYSCDRCNKTFYHCNPPIVITGWQGKCGGRLLPVNIKTFDFCSAACFEEWVYIGLGLPTISR